MRWLLKRLLVVCFILVPSIASAQFTKLQGDCINGNVSVTIPGTQGSGNQKFEQSYPSCTVTVFNAGTVTNSTVFNDSVGTAKANPFTSATNGQWFFYCTPNAHYDVRFSGGGISVAFTRGDVVCPLATSLSQTIPLTWNTDPFTGVITGSTDFICGSGTFTVAATSTILSNIHLVADQGCQFSVNTGITLTISGSMEGSSISQHFVCNKAGFGTCTFTGGKVSAIYPQWFGAVADGSTDDTLAIQGAINSIGSNPGGAGQTSKIYLPCANYKITTLFVGLKQGLDFEGCAEDTSTTLQSTATSGNVLDATACAFCVFRNFQVQLQAGASPAVGMLFTASATPSSPSTQNQCNNVSIVDTSATSSWTVAPLFIYGTGDNVFNHCTFTSQHSTAKPAVIITNTNDYGVVTNAGNGATMVTGTQNTSDNTFYADEIHSYSATAPGGVILRGSGTSRFYGGPIGSSGAPVFQLRGGPTETVISGSTLYGDSGAPTYDVYLNDTTQVVGLTLDNVSGQSSTAVIGGVASASLTGFFLNPTANITGGATGAFMTFVASGTPATVYLSDGYINPQGLAMTPTGSVSNVTVVHPGTVTLAGAATWTNTFSPNIVNTFVPGGDNNTTLGGSANRLATLYTEGVNSGAADLTLTPNTGVIPSANGMKNLGNTSLGWNVVYSNFVQSNGATALQLIGNNGVTTATFGAGILVGTTGSVPAAGQVSLQSTIPVYNNIATVSDGLPYQIATVDQTAQAANIGTTNFYAVPASGQGRYRATCYVTVTQAATVSSTMPACQISYTDNDTNVGVNPFGITSTSTGNSVGATNSAACPATCSNSPASPGSVFINAKASTNIAYATTGYASSGATVMQYAVHVRLERLGN